MSSVWKRFQRINKKATKFRFTASFHELTLHLTPKWQPTKLELVLQRRNRRAVTAVPEWEPGMKDPLLGACVWMPPVNAEVTVTLFKDNHTHNYEDKDWTLVLEDVSPGGKRRQVATSHLNMTQYAGVCQQTDLSVRLNPLSKKILSCNVEFTLSCLFLREGKATDEDMQSLASLMSMNAPNDIAPLDDLEEDDEEGAANEELTHLTARISSLTNSLECDSPSSSTEAAEEDSVIESLTPLESLPRDPSITLSLSEQKPTDSAVYAAHRKKTEETVESRAEEGGRLSPVKERAGSPTEGMEKRTLQDRHALTPLKLPTNETSGLSLKTLATPGQDLMSWCQDTVSGYKGVKITNMTTSWRNGLAFCAVIHHFRPDLIDFSSLSPQDIIGNCRIAFDAGEKMGIPLLIEPQTMMVSTVPDKLAVITYLHQLRAYFTGLELEVSQLGGASNSSSTGFTSTPSSDNTRLSTPSSTMSPKCDLPTTDSIQYSTKAISSPDPLTTTKKSLDPESKENQRPVLMTRQQLMDPFASDEEDPPVISDKRETSVTYKSSSEECNEVAPGLLDLSPLSPTTRTASSPPSNRKSLPPVHQSTNTEHKVISPTEISEAFNTPPATATTSPINSNDSYQTKSTSRHQELKERARLLLEAARRDVIGERRAVSHSQSAHSFVQPIARLQSQRSNVGNLKLRKTDEDDSRQAALRERARKLIADAKQGIITSSRSNSVEEKSKKTDSVTQHGGSDDSATRQVLSPSVMEITPSKLQSFSSLIETIPTEDADPQDKGTRSEYLKGELAVLEEEQRHVDAQAAKLERKLRRVMEAGNKPHDEDRLMKKWFTLVNKKNALIRRQEQLSILEKESNLEQRFELLNRELRTIIAIDDSKKSELQRRQESLLLDELVQIVNMRNDLVTHLDSQEKMLADERRIAQDVSRASVRQTQEKCKLM